MLKTVRVADLRPNPFRNLEEYPLIREKIDALKASIEQTGFWGTIVGRPLRGDLIEIAFGHHRLVALQECGVDPVQVITKPLTNELMLQMMAQENMEEWGTSAWVELETIRATIDAYGKGLIELPKVPAKTNKDVIRYASEDLRSHPYTMATVAEFLGWTSKQHGNGVRPDFACETAFKAMDAIDKGFLREVDLVGLKRTQAHDLIKAQLAVYNSHSRFAKIEAEEAKRDEEKAKIAPAKDKPKLEKRAAVRREQAATHTAVAKTRAVDLGKEGADLFRADKGRDAVQTRARELAVTVPRDAPVPDVDKVLGSLAKILGNIAKEDTLSEKYKLVRPYLYDSTERARKGFCDSIDALIDRLTRMRRAVDTPRSHSDGTRGQHAQKAISQEPGRNGIASDL